MNVGKCEICVFLVQSHFKELILEHAPPPPAIAEFAIANLIKMGFPQRAVECSISICSCHKEVKVVAGYTCPRCKARVCELPTECPICGLTLVSSPHLAKIISSSLSYNFIWWGASISFKWSKPQTAKKLFWMPTKPNEYLLVLQYQCALTLYSMLLILELHVIISKIG